MKRVLLTGATGYIGSHVAVELVNAGYEVVGVDNFSNSSAKVLDGIEKILGRRIDFVEADCTNMKEFSKVFDQFPDIEAAIHFAAFKAVGESVAQPMKYFRNNLHSFENLVELMVTRGKRANIVFSSSATVYGQPALDELPIKEDQPFQEASSPYARTKQIAEGILEDCVKAYPNLHATVLRYFNPIGAHPSAHIGELPNGVPNNLVPFITQTAAGIRECLSVFGDDYDTPDGTCIRDYIHVTDLAKAHILAVKHLMNGGESNIFNLGNGVGYSVKEVIETARKVTGHPIPAKEEPRRAGDPARLVASGEKAREILGWAPEMKDLADIIGSAWKWHQTHPNGYDK